MDYIKSYYGDDQNPSGSRKKVYDIITEFTEEFEGANNYLSPREFYNDLINELIEKCDFELKYNSHWEGVDLTKEWLLARESFISCRPHLKRMKYFSNGSKHTCECGAVVSKAVMYRHLKTKKHKKLMSEK